MEILSPVCVLEKRNGRGGDDIAKTDEGIISPITTAWVDASRNERLLIFFLKF